MSIFGKFIELVRAEEVDDYDGYDDEFDEPEPQRTTYRPSYERSSHDRSSHDRASHDSDQFPSRQREPLREPLSRERERENVIPLHSRAAVEKITARFNIILLEPKAFDECPKLVDHLKSRKPVIINLENIENDTARKIFDFLSGATYALNGNVQKIAQNIFVFLPENVDVQSAESDSLTGDRWK